MSIPFEHQARPSGFTMRDADGWDRWILESEAPIGTELFLGRVGESVPVAWWHGMSEFAALLHRQRCPHDEFCPPEEHFLFEVRCYKRLDSGWTRAIGSIAFGEDSQEKHPLGADDLTSGFTTGKESDNSTWVCAYTTWNGEDNDLRVELNQMGDAGGAASSVEGHYIVAYNAELACRLDVRTQLGAELLRVDLKARA